MDSNEMPMRQRVLVVVVAILSGVVAYHVARGPETDRLSVSFSDDVVESPTTTELSPVPTTTEAQPEPVTTTKPFVDPDVTVPKVDPPLVDRVVVPPTLAEGPQPTVAPACVVQANELQVSVSGGCGWAKVRVVVKWYGPPYEGEVPPGQVNPPILKFDDTTRVASPNTTTVALVAPEGWVCARVVVQEPITMAESRFTVGDPAMCGP